MRTARRVKNIIYWTIGIVLGIGMVFGGVTELNAHGTVDCGGQQMQSSDQCVETDKYGHQTVRTVDQQKSDNTRTGWVLVVLGPLITIGAGFLLRNELRRRPAGAPGLRIPAMGSGGAPGQYPSGPNPHAIPAGYTPQAVYAPQPYAPAQGYPQQPHGGSPSYPQAPYGQGFPQQQAYPQQGGYPQQQSGYPSQSPPPGRQQY
ncbi:hypothetical protein [Nocardia alni]|uniref:hypothetical protein n=1 Tax=Nocardia alni TaxID=2815723 RepID=UPI001C215F75|nr:hypothetical protein [Nocardia alni]